MNEKVYSESEQEEINRFLAEVWVVTRYVLTAKRRQQLQRRAAWKRSF
jgi:hypothetical protein